MELHDPSSVGNHNDVIIFGRALTVSLVAFAGTPGAVATQDQAILAGQPNTETSETVVQNTNVTVGCAAFSNNGLKGCGIVGVEGSGSVDGVFAFGNTYGVEGDGAAGGTGVFGHNEGSTGIGVWGQTGGSGSAVYGQATGNGVGVFGDTTSGTGVEARSTTGNALDVIGKAVFSGSGIATVPAGAKNIQVTLSGATTASMILATVQQSGGFYVKYVVPASGSFTIFINKAPTSPATVKVAYFVLN
jgi:hypothetical protein